MLNQIIKDLTEQFKTNHILIPQGGDFQYTNAHMNFDSSDRLIESFNERFHNVTLLYSTPSEYI